MAYYLRKEKKKKGIYLQMYESYWDKDKKAATFKKHRWLLAMCKTSSLTECPIRLLIIQTYVERKMRNAPSSSRRRNPSTRFCFSCRI